MDESGQRESQGLAVQLMQAELDDHRAAEKPLGPTIAELQAAGALPAFPQMARSGDLAVSEGGMSLRDYNAAKFCAAMVSTIRSDSDYLRLRELAFKHGLDGVSEFFAQEAYKQADAMLAARGAA